MAVGHPLFSTDFPNMCVLHSLAPKKIEMQIQIGATYCWIGKWVAFDCVHFSRAALLLLSTERAPSGKLQAGSGQFTDSKRESESPAPDSVIRIAIAGKSLWKLLSNGWPNQTKPKPAKTKRTEPPVKEPRISATWCGKPPSGITERNQVALKVRT